MAKFLLTLVLLLSFAGASYSALYKWVDKEGHVHYGDCPPADCKAEKIETAPGPSDEEIKRSHERTEKLIQEQKQREAVRKKEKEIEQKKAKQAVQREEEHKRKCKVLKSRLHLLKQHGVVSFIDDKGNVIRPTDAQREKMIKNLEATIKKNCK